VSLGNEVAALIRPNLDQTNNRGRDSSASGPGGSGGPGSDQVPFPYLIKILRQRPDIPEWTKRGRILTSLAIPALLPGVALAAGCASKQPPYSGGGSKGGLASGKKEAPS
jgi:hypothetical protein